METYLDKIKAKIGKKIFLTPQNLVQLGVFRSRPSAYRALKNKELSYFQREGSIRIPSESVIEYFEKNFHEAKEIEPKRHGIEDAEIMKVTGHTSSKMIYAYDKTSAKDNFRKKMVLI